MRYELIVKSPFAKVEMPKLAKVKLRGYARRHFMAQTVQAMFGVIQAVPKKPWLEPSDPSKGLVD